ncbi:AMP-binding protein [Streptomyces celluloflavus]|uniref:AMP-binding protein n=1 Tax=Streptomyces celluloflavus TaxID=58344 RepID=A0ABW7RMU5_9ACTN
MAETIEDSYPLTPVQQALLAAHGRRPQAGVGAEQVLVSFTGALNPHVFAQAWQYVADRHPALRTAFARGADGRARQVVHRGARFPLEVLDWRATGETVQDARLRERLDRERPEGFPLGRAPLMRATLIRRGARQWTFAWRLSHLVADGWSCAVALGEFAESYRALLCGRTPRLAPAPPYRDYLTWWAAHSPRKDAAFWAGELGGFTAPAPLSWGGAPTPPGHGGGHGVVACPLERPGGRAARVLRAHRLTRETLVLGAWLVLLSRYHGRADVLCGATLAHRPAQLPGARAVLGPMTLTLPVRGRVEGARTAVSWLCEVQARVAAAAEHPGVPWARVHRAAGPGPLLESSVCFPGAPLPPTDLVEAGLRQTAAACDTHPRHPLTVLIMPGEAPALRIVHDRTTVSPAAATRIAHQLREVWSHLTTHPELPLDHLPLSAGPAVPVPPPVIRGAAQPLTAGFARWVARTPQATAVTDEHTRLTYAQLDELATRTATALRERGVGPGSRVALLLPPSAHRIAALIGILKTGAAYIPLDPGHPPSHLTTLLTHSQATTIVTTPHTRPHLPPTWHPALLLLDHTGAPLPHLEESGAPLPHWSAAADVSADAVAFASLPGAGVGGLPGAGTGDLPVGTVGAGAVPVPVGAERVTGTEGAGGVGGAAGAAGSEGAADVAGTADTERAAGTEDAAGSEGTEDAAGAGDTEGATGAAGAEEGAADTRGKPGPAGAAGVTGTADTERIAGTEHAARIAGTEGAGGSAGARSTAGSERVTRTADTKSAAGTEHAASSESTQDAADYTDTADAERSAGTRSTADSKRATSIAGTADTERTAGTEHAARIAGAEGVGGSAGAGSTAGSERATGIAGTADTERTAGTERAASSEGTRDTAGNTGTAGARGSASARSTTDSERAADVTGTADTERTACTKHAAGIAGTTNAAGAGGTESAAGAASTACSERAASVTRTADTKSAAGTEHAASSEGTQDTADYTDTADAERSAGTRSTAGSKRATSIAGTADTERTAGTEHAARIAGTTNTAGAGGTESAADATGTKSTAGAVGPVDAADTAGTTGTAGTESSANSAGTAGTESSANSAGAAGAGGTEGIAGTAGTTDPADTMVTADAADTTVTADAACVLYTSGSTGPAKAVVLTHANVQSMVAAARREFGFGPQENWALTPSPAFGAGVWEIWNALSNGASLTVVPPQAARTAHALRRFTAARHVTVLSLTPATFAQLAQDLPQDATAPLPDLRHLFLGGGHLAPEAVHHWIKHHGDTRPTLHHLYGLAEATAVSTHHRITAANTPRTGPLPIGKPLANQTARVLDHMQRPVPAGVAGELHLAGPAIAAGHPGHPHPATGYSQATAFPPDLPICRTGDLVRLRDDGALELLGRLDPHPHPDTPHTDPDNTPIPRPRHPHERTPTNTTAHTADASAHTTGTTAHDARHDTTRDNSNGGNGRGGSSGNGGSTGTNSSRSRSRSSGKGGSGRDNGGSDRGRGQGNGRGSSKATNPDSGREGINAIDNDSSRKGGNASDDDRKRGRDRKGHATGDNRGRGRGRTTSDDGSGEGDGVPQPTAYPTPHARKAPTDPHQPHRPRTTNQPPAHTPPATPNPVPPPPPPRSTTPQHTAPAGLPPAGRRHPPPGKAPRTPTEQQITAYLEQLLETGQIDPHQPTDPAPGLHPQHTPHPNTRPEHPLDTTPTP